MAYVPGTTFAQLPDGLEPLALFDEEFTAISVWAESVVAIQGSLTPHGVVIAKAASTIASTGALSDGQIVVGQTGADPAAKTMTGDGSLAASGALTVNSISTAVLEAALNALPTTQPAVGHWWVDGGVLVKVLP